MFRQDVDEIAAQKDGRSCPWAWPAAAIFLAAALAIVALARRPQRVEAQSVVIRDRAGHERIRLAADGSDGGARITVRDAAEHARIVVSVDAEGGSGIYELP